MSSPRSNFDTSSADLEYEPELKDGVLSLLEEGFRSAHELILLVSPRLEILYGNAFSKRLLRRLGSASGEANLLGAVLLEDGELLRTEVFPMVLNGHSWEGEIRLLSSTLPSGRLFHWSVRPVFGAMRQGTVQALWIHGRNVSEVRRIEARSERMARSLEHERQSLRTIFDQAPIGIAVLEGPKHVYTYTNPVYLSFIPKRENEILGKPLLEAFPEMAGQGFDAILDRVYETGQTFSGRDLPADLVNSDGTMRRIYVDLVYHARYDISGKIDGIIAIGSDVTSRFKAQRLANDRAADFSALAELMPQILFTMDAKGLPTYFNKKWFEYTGFDSLNGTDWSTVLHPLGRQAALAAIESCRKEKRTLEVEVLLRRADNTYRWHRVCALPVGDSTGDVVKWIGVMTDIEDLKKIAETLHFAKCAAERASAMKSSFLSNLSHEIRTPLTAIIGTTQLAMLGAKCSPECAHSLSTVLRNSNHMLALVDDILDLSKIEAGKLQIEWMEISLPRLLSIVRETISPQATAKGLELVFEQSELLPERIVSDPTRLQQVLLNLLTNAVKFTESGRVTFRALCGDEVPHRECETLQFEFEDTGCGITNEQRDGLFEPFVQGDLSTTRVYGGSGLGLAISRRLAHALGGEVSLVRSVPGQGSLFSLSVPRDGSHHGGNI